MRARKSKGANAISRPTLEGLLPGVHAGPASVQDRDGAKDLFCLFCHLFLSLTLIFANGGCRGKREEWVRQMGTCFGHRSMALEIIKRSHQV